jgi:hypothetical protein
MYWCRRLVKTEEKYQAYSHARGFLEIIAPSLTEKHSGEY